MTDIAKLRELLERAVELEEKAASAEPAERPDEGSPAEEAAETPAEEQAEDDDEDRDLEQLELRVSALEEIVLSILTGGDIVNADPDGDGDDDTSPAGDTDADEAKAACEHPAEDRNVFADGSEACDSCGFELKAAGGYDFEDLDLDEKAAGDAGVETKDVSTSSAPGQTSLGFGKTSGGETVARAHSEQAGKYLPCPKCHGNDVKMVDGKAVCAKDGTPLTRKAQHKADDDGDVEVKADGELETLGEMELLMARRAALGN